MTGIDEVFAALSREPDLDSAELQAHDATDRLLLELAAASSDPDPASLGAGTLSIIGDRHGALTLGAAAALGARGIRVFQDPLLA
ncbi:methyltransferase, partial [Leucobacter soli]